MAQLASQLTLSCPATFGDFRTRTSGSHAVLRACNSGAKSGRELFKCSKDAESLLLCTRKKFLVGGCSFVVSDVVSGRLLGRLGPLLPSLGPKLLGGSISLKYLLETWLQSESFDT